MARRQHARRRRRRRNQLVVAVGLPLALGLLAIAAITSAAAPSLPSPRTGSTAPTSVRLPATSATPSATAIPHGPSPTPGPSAAPTPAGPASPTASGRFPGGLLIADRGNGRLLVVTDTKRIVWTFPGPGSLPRGQQFSADDAFVDPAGTTIVANDEAHQVIDRIDIASRRVVWQYGTYNHAGSGPGELHTPDDAYPLANGDILVADIRNCRILEIAPSKRIVRHWGRAGLCTNHPPASFANPNGDTPLPDGGLLVTEINGSRVVRLRRDGHVVFDIHVPVTYPSDAQPGPHGSIVVAGYEAPGTIYELSPSGRVLWRYAVRSGPNALDHPSLALPLADGTIVVNDDQRARVVVIDPRTDRIVWQYGITDQPGRARGHLSTPDGINVLPPGTIPGLG